VNDQRTPRRRSRIVMSATAVAQNHLRCHVRRIAGPGLPTFEPAVLEAFVDSNADKGGRRA
jgi:hypothetical protein